MAVMMFAKERCTFARRGLWCGLVLLGLALAARPVFGGETGGEEAEGEFFAIAQVHYHGGGDWYEDKTSMPRLQVRIEKEFGVPAYGKRKVVELTDDDLFGYPMLFMTGHGNVVFSPEEVVRLRKYLDGGGFLWASDDYGMDKAFRREMKKVFPGRELVEVPFDHEIYHVYYDFPAGLPKVHEHAGGPPGGYGIFLGGRLTVFYDFNTDVGDGLEAASIHGDPAEVREQAMRMAVNIVVYAMTN